MHIRQLDGVLDDLDLLAETADLVVGDVGHLLQHQFFDLGTHQLLEHEPGAGIHPHMVPDADELALQWRRDLDHAFLVGPSQDDHPLFGEDLLDGDDFAGLIERPHVDHVERLIE